MFHSSVEFFLCSLNVIIIGFGGYYVMQGEMDYRDLLTFSLYISSFISPMRKLANFSETFANGFAGLNRFVEVMRTEPTVQDKPDAKELKNVRGEIRVDHVSFAYDADLAVLHDVSLTVAPGETVAIVGPSGGGKSTLCQLIPRFYDPDSGEVLVDGKPVKEYTLRALRRKIGFVMQKSVLFSDTIANNIRWGKADASDDEVKAAAETAQADSFISGFADGYDSFVAEKGASLSGGQKQRVSIARALVRKPEILILDDSTSALDLATEARLRSALHSSLSGTTVVMVAQRIASVRDADRIAVIENDGSIIHCAPHEELMRVSETYRDIYNSQMQKQAGGE